MLDESSECSSSSIFDIDFAFDALNALVLLDFRVSELRQVHARVTVTDLGKNAEVAHFSSSFVVLCVPASC